MYRWSNKKLTGLAIIFISLEMLNPQSSIAGVFQTGKPVEQQAIIKNQSAPSLLEKDLESLRLRSLHNTETEHLEIKRPTPHSLVAPVKISRVEVRGYRGKQYVHGEIKVVEKTGEINGYVFSISTDSTSTYIYGKLDKNRNIIAYDAEGNLYRLEIDRMPQHR